MRNNISYQDIANHIDDYLKSKTLFTSFNNQEIFHVFDYMKVNGDQALQVLEQCKGYMNPNEVFEMLRHWKINFGWDANKVATISLLVSELTDCRFINDYIRYFIKRIMDFYESSIKGVKTAQRKIDKKDKEIKELRHEKAELFQKNEYQQDQIEMYIQIQHAHINFLLEQAEKIEVADFRLNNYKKIVEQKNEEIEGLKQSLANTNSELKNIKNLLKAQGNNQDAASSNHKIKSSKSQTDFPKQQISTMRCVMANPTQVYIPETPNNPNGYQITNTDLAQDQKVNNLINNQKAKVTMKIT
ncbi:hypothetical protein TVAG_253120 [Trichomonas vaginalis G3]|uniref:Uncharacterized protein n=1 Tax=Trichomonas vaginalis (strain ATCC PRA-98 / G3) TaxID=412133 RepID=A2EXH1_TRIV3|nr:protein ubiquitination [Trichomonas vaginalis G3]EAY02661.1 hypothetical protein TVAG_253120 [Trichomonas vaginalis G3]KAI5550153.1 protein ubiquitination [Trichomonas vaginalis G3]|eukprot:XP_001314884.1 hypothetical protein [Trichomonas vaginalis G3]